MKTSIKFVIVFFLCVAQSFAVVALATWWVNPYSLYREVESDPQAAVWLSKQLRLAKGFYARALKPQGIALGASTSQLAIDVDHPGWNADAQPRYNLSFPGAYMYENLRYYQHARALAPVKQILLGLDFVAFNIFAPLSDDYRDAMIAADANGAPRKDDFHVNAVALVSLDAVTASQKKALAGKRGTHYSNGREIPEETEERRWRSAMLGSATGFITRLLLPPPAHRFCLEDANGDNPNFEYLETLLKTAQADGADLRLYIQPAHATLLEALAELGYLETYMDWERKLTALVERVNASASDSTPIPLWDFSAYSAFTAETLPQDEATPMQWYWDVGHYKKELGDRVQDRVFGYVSPERPGLESFGARLTGATIESHLASLLDKQKRYRKANATDLEELKARIKDIEQNLPAFDCKALNAKNQPR
ncbi:MAG: hypothetical protein G3M78_07315 [Candidatus Nitrohelix vancouverensis]|uniref:Uncharacterized protein n=1 Tax=Candidatus Nitrohelix vancouverensis TaxID=2705534 RepID=A0A7T0C282_9BACT|nr:MAG: hypothetical protein G3M78_07315 [Candidatus Nitrohelix vancouverensis]